MNKWFRFVARAGLMLFAVGLNQQSMVMMGIGGLCAVLAWEIGEPDVIEYEG